MMRLLDMRFSHDPAMLCSRVPSMHIALSEHAFATDVERLHSFESNYRFLTWRVPAQLSLQYRRGGMCTPPESILQTLVQLTQCTVGGGGRLLHRVRAPTAAIGSVWIKW